MTKRKTNPQPGGRPKAKPGMTDEEFNIATRILAEGDQQATDAKGATSRWRPRGLGLRAAVAAINVHRGVDRLLDHAAQKRRRVSPRWLQRELAARVERGETPSVAKLGKPQKEGRAGQPSQLREVRSTEPQAIGSEGDDALAERLAAAARLSDVVSLGLPPLSHVRCLQCGRRGELEPGAVGSLFRHGWPKCPLGHGTMRVFTKADAGEDPWEARA